MPDSLDSVGLLKRIWRVLNRRERRKFLLSILSRVVLVPLDLAGLAVLGFSASLVSNSASGGYVSKIASQLMPFVSETNVYALFAAFALCLFLAKAVLSALISRRAFRFASELEVTKSTELYKAFIEGQVSAFALSRKDVESAIVGASHMAFGVGAIAISTLTTELSLLAIVSLYLAFSNLLLFLALFLYVALLGILVYWRITGRVSYFAKEVELSGISVSAFTRESVSGYRQITLSGLTNNLVRIFRFERSRLAKANSEIHELGNLTRYVIEVAIMAAVALLVIQRYIFPSLSLSPEVVATFLAGAFRMTGTLLPIQASIGQIKQASKHSDLYFKLSFTRSAGADHPENLGPDSLSTTSPLSLSIKEVDFRYSKKNQATLSGISLEINPGEFVALMGKSGVGKSTFLEVLAGFRDVTRGAIAINGVSIKNFISRNPGSIAFMPQEPTLFSASLYENVTLDFGFELFAENKIRYEEILDVCQLKASLSDDILNGTSKLGGEGQSVSGGQAQRISLARALFQKPRLLILDEPTSALDVDTERHINLVLQKLAGSVTILLVTHREAAAIGATRKFELVRGLKSLREVGKPVE